MKKIALVIIGAMFLGSAGLSAYIVFHEVSSEAPEQSEAPAVLVPQEIAEPVPTHANLTMAYINESPDGSWTGSWKNACEEAAITMVEKYYQGATEVSVADAMVFMQTLFDAQQAAYGSDRDSDAARTLALIDGHTSYYGTIVENPTLEAIKHELDAGRPIIALHHGFALQNKNIPFLPTGSSYHATVIKGYDDAQGIFYVHDTGDIVEGEDHVYTYDLFMESLHDYSYVTRKADGPPRVIFTSPQP